MSELTKNYQLDPPPPPPDEPPPQDPPPEKPPADPPEPTHPPELEVRLVLLSLGMLYVLRTICLQFAHSCLRSPRPEEW